MGRIKLWCAIAVIALAGTACGTQLPDSAFGGATTGPTSVNGTPLAEGASATPSAGTTSGSGGITSSGGNQGIPGTQGHSVTVSGGPSGGGQQAGSCTWSGPWVSGDKVKVGEIVSGPGNPFSPNQFIPGYYGALSYFGYLNAQGGLCGKQIQYIKCDDNGDRNQNVACARKLVEQDHVFALVATNVFQYAAAGYVADSGTPDMGGQPITPDAYFSHKHKFAITGSYYLNDGSSGAAPPPYWGLSGLGVFFKQRLNLKRVGLVYYAEADSAHGANLFRGFFTNQGVKVDDEQIPLAGDPSPQVQDMKSKGDQVVVDALDLSGNARLCQAMANYQYNVPKISTISTWSDDFGGALGGYPCASNYYTWGFSTNYDDASNPQIQLFQKAYATFAPGAPRSQWSLEGWAAAMWFADAVKSCSGTISRACVEKFIDTKSGYAAQGLLDPHTSAFQHWKSPPAKWTQCYTVVKWSGGTHGTWSTVADHNNNCYTTAFFNYQ